MQKRLDTEDPKVFDTWRALYDKLSDKEQIEFYDDIEKKWPWQQHFHVSYFVPAFTGTPVRVLEVGGWKGELASQMLRLAPWILSWKNIELCPRAVEKTVPMPVEGVYSAEIPDTFKWFKKKRAIEADVFVSAHTIEHFTDQDLWKLLMWADGIPLICLEAPISFGSNNWDGYGGTHILKAGWCEIGVFMEALGYEVIFIHQHAFHYRKK
jgi:hypothetical protein